MSSTPKLAEPILNVKKLEDSIIPAGVITINCAYETDGRGKVLTPIVGIQVQGDFDGETASMSVHRFMLLGLERAAQQIAGDAVKYGAASVSRAEEKKVKIALPTAADVAAFNV